MCELSIDPVDADHTSQPHYRPLHPRPPLPFLFCLLALGLGGCERTVSRGSLDPVSVELRLGTAGLVAPGRWNLVYVTARASSGVFRGQVRIRGLDPQTRRPLPETFRGRLEVGTEEQTVAFPVRLGETGSLVVDIQAPGLAPDRRWELPVPVEDCYRILEISNRAPLVANRLDGPINTWLNISESALPADHVRVARARPGELPASPLALDVADLVVLSDLSGFESYPEVLDALIDWVRRGGCVVGIPGPSWTARQSPALLEMFGLSRPPLVEMDSASWPSLDPDGSIYRFHPLPAASFEASRLLLEHAHGSGRAFLTRYAPEKDLLASGSSDEVFRSEVARSWKRVIVDSWARFRAQRRMLTFLVEPPAMRALYRFSGVSYPSRESVLVFVLVYLGVGFYLSACVFAYFKRLEWTYIFMLVVAGGASVAIYHFGLISAVEKQSVDSITVAKLRAGGSGRADGAVFFGISSPTRRTVGLDEWIGDGIPSQPSFVEMGDPFQANRVTPRAGSYGDPSRLLPRDYETSSGRVRMDGLELHPNATTYLRIDREFELGGGMSAVWTPRGIAVDNRTRHTLECYSVDGQGIWKLGKVSPRDSSVLQRQGTRWSTADWEDRDTVHRALTFALLTELLQQTPRKDALYRPVQILARVIDYEAPANGLGENRRSECFLFVDVETGQ